MSESEEDDDEYDYDDDEEYEDDNQFIDNSVVNNNNTSFYQAFDQSRIPEPIQESTEMSPVCILIKITFFSYPTIPYFTYKIVSDLVW